MTQLNKNARARRRARRAAAAIEAVTARLLGTTGRMSRSHDDMMDAHMSGMKWSPDEIGRMQLSNRSTWAAGNARVMNKINGLRADSIVIDEFADFTNLERRITS